MWLLTAATRTLKFMQGVSHLTILQTIRWDINSCTPLTSETLWCLIPRTLAVGYYYICKLVQGRLAQSTVLLAVYVLAYAMWFV